MRYCIVVPANYNIQSALLISLIKNPLAFVWITAISLFTIIRKCLHHLMDGYHPPTTSDLFFDTFGISFGVCTGTLSKYKNLSESTLLVFISMFALLASIVCSGMLFRKFTFQNYVTTMNTITELENSNLTILTPFRPSDNVILSQSHFQK